MAKPGGDSSSGISLGDVLGLPERHPACRRCQAQPGSCTERENLSLRCQGRHPSGAHRKDQSTDAGHRGGAARSSEEGPVMGLERRGCVVRPWPLANWKREEPVDEAKPFKATAEPREPCDSRGSCTVLGAPGGAIPPGDSTTASFWARVRTPASPPIDCSASSSDPMMEGPWCRFRREARARERH